ncbi:NitT/TauT family transport system substrate-binding protein [Parasporobacterium paucivorans DSM 15970]|uniref:NitT/TauT family transport system substrate-binding protein n=1 Tax=Parasporobacterium paucivorans DSM 15970 TaxID=1122934 RepID=A0A1M6J3H3_9FIRM|nr:ABC transporter substrate-binding protein [Parasporobacterium paucivorans]SHJ41207.1 NitT/TauT family transport system substrate-binding protein [Parasporobacterium paucivorans DSM 15970]
MKRRITTLVLTAILAVSFLSGCQKDSGAETQKETETTTKETVEAIDIRVGGLKGPTSMGMVQLMEAAEQKTAFNNYTFTIAASADELTPKLIQGDLDIAAVPANLASVLYNNTKGAVELLAVNTLGVNYIVEVGDTISSMEDLRGKTIYATGKGSTPEFALRYLLSEYGLDPDKDVTIEWKSEPTEVVALLAQGGGIAMLPQPFVTVAQSSVAGLNIAVDMTEEWDKLENGSMLITGVLVVRKEFAEQYPQQVAKFLDEYKESTEYVNANVGGAALLVEKYGIVAAAVAQKAIPYCNITYMEGSEMKTAMEGYLNVLFEQKPEAIGGALPGDAFYFER